MVRTKFQLVLLFLSRTVFCWIGHIENRSNLMAKYTEYCGSDTLCDLMDAVSSDKNSTQASKISPVCFCTEECQINGICCPDISFSICVQTEYFVSRGDFIGENRFMMVTSCPQINDPTTVNSCLEPIDQTNYIHQLPVYSLRTNKTYANTQCSKCHGENEIIPWEYSFSCKSVNIDLDMFSDTITLWRVIKQYNCSIKYTPPRNYEIMPCQRRSLVRECNITGDWDEYYSDVEYACKNYWNPYEVYQNVFCFLCNTGAKQRNSYYTIDKYNDRCKSGIPENNDTARYDEYFLNTTATEKDVSKFTDAWVRMSEEYDPITDMYITNITILSWGAIYTVGDLLSKQNSTKDTIVSEDIVNLTSLYEEYVKSGGHHNWCHDDYRVDKIYPGFRARRNCLCDENCYKFASCCPDAAYYLKRRCTPAFLGQVFNTRPTPSYYYLISKCPTYYDNTYVKIRCETLVDYDLLNIPIIDAYPNEMYKNFYCYLCHKQHTMNQNLRDLIPWNVSVLCPLLMFPLFMSSVNSIFQAAEQNNCSIYFATTYGVESCTFENDTIIGKCNASGLVKSVSENARIMCEEPTMNAFGKSRNYMYKNQICDMCNSEIFEDSISKCYNLQKKSKTSRIYCEDGDLHLPSYPFRNIFCKRCNTAPISTKPFQDADEVTYRDLFSLFESSKTTVRPMEECNEKNFVDVYEIFINFFCRSLKYQYNDRNNENKCRMLSCSRGKVLENNSCSLLAPYVKVAQYNVAFRVFISTNSRTHNVFFILQHLQQFLQHEIHEGDLKIDEQYVHSNKSCDVLKTLKSTSTPEEAIIYLRINITSRFLLVDRRNIELHFLNFTRISINYKSVSLYFKESAEAWFLPVLLRQRSSEYLGCNIKYISGNAFFAHDVNKLLTCKQIELASNEYVYNEDYSSIYVTKIRKSFKINEFSKIENGSVRICSDSYKLVQHSELNSVTKIYFTTVLMIRTYISTIFSLLALLLTFLIYCMLPPLRTVPGKSIMCFVFFLFFAQLFFLIRPQYNDLFSCELVGGLTHYFWLSVFTCANICCYHMFRSFVRNSLVCVDQSTDRKLYIKYILVFYVMSVLPIVINLILESFIDSDRFGYGGSKCFLVSWLALLLVFILPLVLQIIFNIVMFSFPYHHIRTTSRVQSSQERNEFCIFLKLFLLTGISWILMIVDGFFEVSPFTFLATIINGSQGIFLSIYYVCNKKVFTMLKNRPL